MTTLAYLPTDSGTATEGRPRVLLLRADDGGWSLLGPDGERVFHAAGLRGRQACLAYARDHGVLALISR